MSTSTTSAATADDSFRAAFGYLVLVAPATVFAFWKSYFGILGDLPAGVTATVHLHAALMFLWLAMLIAQAWFVRTNRFRWHRWVGRSSFVVAPSVILSGLATTHAAFNKPIPPGASEVALRSLDVITLGQLVAFGATWWLAIAHRRNPAMHVRFIVSTLFAVGNAVVFRAFYFWVPGFDSDRAAVTANGTVLVSLLLLLIALDWRKGIRRSPYWVVTAILVVLHAGYFTFGRSEAWISFCHWFAGIGG